MVSHLHQQMRFCALNLRAQGQDGRETPGAARFGAMGEEAIFLTTCANVGQLDMFGSQPGQQ